ncbi:MAG: isoaspartyl peptidase/L-asparaginase family protein [Candidatus Krumholzibacteriia bacterium]
MRSRRDFLKVAALGMPGLGVIPGAVAAAGARDRNPVRRPLVASTWKHGLAANEAAWKILSDRGWALDAVEAGVRVSEADPGVRSVGYGGLPDRDGHVTLDACIMDERGNCGSVAFLRHIQHPVSVARTVMQKTSHVMLVGEGALQFAVQNGYEKQNLLTPESEAAWREWLKTSRYAPRIDAMQHDTIGMLAIDSEGRLSGSCSTSGLAWKMHGRVGDSPIIGAALYVDTEVGGACATGVGEAVMKTVGSFLVVELMRQGISPAEACKRAVERIIRRMPDDPLLQVGYLAIHASGEVGGFSIRPGFAYAVHDESGNTLTEAPSWRS